MSLPHVLLIDDSEAILAFEASALSGHARLSTAQDGEAGLAMLRKGGVDLVVLDLSMPVMDGDEVLARMRREPRLASLPVVIVSSERDRGERLLGQGAQAFLPKPIRADALLQTVVRVLEETERLRRRGGLSFLQVEVGGVALGLPLGAVDQVALQCWTEPLPGGPAYLSELCAVAGEPVLVLDLAERLGVAHSVALAERRLVVLASEGVRLALCVDEVHDPEELERSEVTLPDALGAADFGPLQGLLLAMAQTARGPLPVLDPKGLLSRELIQRLPALLRAAQAGEGQGR